MRPDADDDRADALRALRRTAVPYVAVDDKADASEPGRERRADYHDVARRKGLQLEEIEARPSGRRDRSPTRAVPRRPVRRALRRAAASAPSARATSVRDAPRPCHGRDVVVDSHKNWFPCDFEELINVAMTGDVVDERGRARGLSGKIFTRRPPTGVQGLHVRHRSISP